MKINKLTFFIGLIILFIILNNLVFRPFNILCWDVFGYYLYLPFKFLYHDLGLLNDSVIQLINDKYHNTVTFYQAMKLPSGLYVMKYTMGLAIFYSPFFLIGHIIAILFNFPADGFSAPYQYSIFFGGIIYSIIGIIFLTRVLRRLFKDSVVISVILLIIFATNYLVHITMYGQNANSHNYLFTAYSLILWLTIKWHETYKPKYAILLAVICGLTILSRPSEVICLLIPFFWQIKNYASFKDKLQLYFKYKFQVLMFGAILLAIGSMQFIYWKIYTGKFLFNSYGGNPGEGFEFFSPYTIQVLFSFRKGWFIYTPIMLFAFWGLYFLYKRNRAIFFAILLYVVCNLYIVSSWSSWWYAQCFSQRGLIQSYPIMAILLGYSLTWLNERKVYAKVMGYLIISLLLFLNIYQTIQFHYGIIDGDRMTRAYYFATFGKLHATEQDKKLLMVNRAFDGKEKFTNENEYHITLQKELDFEATNVADSTKAFCGKFSFKMDSSMIYSPAIEIPYSMLTSKDHAWVRVIAYVLPTSDVKSNPFSLVVHFSHKGRAYNYRASDSDEQNLALNCWNKIQFDYLTPEVRQKNDLLRVYFWHRGKKPVYIDNLSVTIFEKTD